jgi:hypothetical protein
MSGTPPRPRRLRALLVAGALSVSMFASALPAAAQEVPAGLPVAAEASPALAQKVDSAGWIWTRSAVSAGEGEVSIAGWIWTR